MSLVACGISIVTTIFRRWSLVFVLVGACAVTPAATAHDRGAEAIGQSRTVPLRIVKKPNPARDRDDCTQGKVVLRVTFNSDGRIGKVGLIGGLSSRLNERTIAAAKEIVFEPKQIDGRKVTVTRFVTYYFE